MILVTEGNQQYYIHGSMLEGITRTNTITQYPTVEGTSFSDHYYREPDSPSFRLQSSEISKSLIYTIWTDEAGTRHEDSLSTQEIEALLARWFTDGVRLTVTTLRMSFPNQVLKSYSWSDRELSIFSPTLSFTEAMVQTLRVGVILNPDQYYQAAYGSVVAVGGSSAIQSEANLGSALMAGASGAVVGAMIGSVIPGVGTVAGAIIGGAIGFFGSLLG